MHLTREQFRIAETLGCSFQPAAPDQIARLSMQRRVFWLDDQAFLGQRQDGFYETAATLTRLLQEAKVALPPEAVLAEPEPAPPALAEPVLVEPAAVEPTVAEPAPAAAAVPEEEAAAEPPPPARAAPRRRQPVAPAPAPEETGEAPEDQPDDQPEPAAAAEAMAEAAPIAALLPRVAPPPSARAETARLVAAFVASTPVAPAELPELIRSIHQSVLSLSRR